MNSIYVELNRSFAPVTKECTFNGDDHDLLNVWGLRETKKWADLLNFYRVVILAEAGAGKTEEMKAVTKRLRTDGKKAFFLRLEQLCSNFETSFDIGLPDEFMSWLLSNEEGWFFLDSVDEARLKGPHQFEEAVRKFAYKLGENVGRAHIYITSRVSEWRQQTDFEFITDRLSYKEINISDQETKSNFEENQSKQSRKSNFTSSENNVEPYLFVLCPLEDSQISIFSREFGVSTPDKFLVEIQKKEAAIYAKRPQDLLQLINYWNKYGNLGSHQKMMEESISSKLKERDPDHEIVQPLSTDEARHGAEILAATVTFQKRNRIFVPDGDTVANLETINPRDVLSDWENNKIGTLLQRPIFDGAIYGTVRFHHRSVREYLTAQWLLRLLQEGKSRRAVEALFFAERYGERVLIPSMRSILSWLLLWDDKIREKTVEIVPEVLIQGGDPSSLPLAVRKNALEKYCKGYAYHKNGRYTFDMAELRRFSQRDLSSTIKQLLVNYRKNENLCQLLLEMIWQGDIVECAEEALAIALDSSQNEYPRIYGIRAIDAVGSHAQKERLVKSFLAEFTKSNDGSFVGELINAFAPAILKVQDILLLLKSVVIDPEEGHLNTTLHLGLKEVTRKKWTIPEVAEFINRAILLLTEPPVIEKRYFEVSHRYNWLIPFVILAVERVIKCKDQSAFNECSLSILLIAPEERNFVEYFHAEEHSLAELVSQWPQLNHALFWFNVSFLRKQLDKKGERLIDGWRLKMRGYYWKFTIGDFDSLLEAVRTKSFIDDRLVALSEAFEIYKENGRSAAHRKKMKEAVRGEEELDKKLVSYFHPPPMPAEIKKARRSIRNSKKQQADRNKKEVEKRQKSRVWLQENIANLRDTTIASQGKVWNSTNYLLHEIWNKQNNHNQWARADWELLIPEFGRDIAESYRDGCIGYWRKYCPKILSEEKGNQEGTPTAVIVGLSGLMMEAQSISDWPKGFSEEEAKLACRYAVEELNGFPIWLEKLHAAFPHIVEERILIEIEWEISKFKGDSPCHYVLDDVNWQADWLKPKIAQRILSYLEKCEPRHDETIKKALEIVLADANLDKDLFISIARIKIGIQMSEERKAIWLAAWMSIESEQALEELKKFLAEMLDAKSATTAAMTFLTELLGTRRERVNRIYSDYNKPSILFALYKLMREYIRSSEDIRHKGCYSPGLRDDAQDARERLLQLLQEIPGKQTYLALLELSNTHQNRDMKDWYASLAYRRAEVDAELKIWQSRDVSVFASETEKNPASHRELFDLTVFRLLDLKDEFENGAMSSASAFQKITGEREHRIYIGGWLRDNSIGRYSVAHENELADATRPDLFIFSNGIDGMVPIELKIACSWTAKVLEERLRNQLCGQYLRDAHSTCGIFLLVYCGRKETWEHPTTQERLNFDQLLKFLEIVACEIVQKDNKIELIKVIGIDLKKRTMRLADSLQDRIHWANSI